jgi:hypothetical protein
MIHPQSMAKTGGASKENGKATQPSDFYATLKPESYCRWVIRARAMLS